MHRDFGILEISEGCRELLSTCIFKIPSPVVKSSPVVEPSPVEICSSVEKPSSVEKSFSVEIVSSIEISSSKDVATSAPSDHSPSASTPPKEWDGSL